jgi:phosphatidylserine decarboxylase
MYFIEKALKANWLAMAFAILSIGTVFSLGGAVPILSMTYLSQNVFGSRGLIVPILAVAILIYVSLGGIRRLGRFAGVFVPLGLILFTIFYFRIFEFMPFGAFLISVFQNAFRIDSIAIGGTLGLLALVGQALGSFCITIEMGIGKSAGVSGAVRTDYPFKQGLVAMIPPVFESLVISTMTIYALFSYNAVSIEDQLYLLSYLFGFKNTISGILFISSFIILGMVSLFKH